MASKAADGAGARRRFWVCDSGTDDAERQIAADAAQLSGHAGNGDMLRFHRFLPAATVGRHQAMERELRMGYCRDNGVATARRITAGGALYLDPGQQCFSLTVPAAKLGATLSERLAAAAGLVSRALAALGVSTSFKAPNDLQVADRQKIASVFLAEQGDSALVFATIICELDIAAAMKALLVPTEKLTVTGLEHARQRMTSLAEVLGRVPAPEEVRSAVTASAAELLPAVPRYGEAPEMNAAEKAPDMRWHFDGAAFETKDKVEGATLRLLLGLDGSERVEKAAFATDAHLSPDALLRSLARQLQGLRLDDVAMQARQWLAAQACDMAGLGKDDIVRLIERAAAKRGLQRVLGLSPEQASGMMLAGNGRDPADALAKASVMLVPYCAKPAWCKWRHTIDCVECGMCEVGDAYTLARERNMEVITITNFEHLSDTLAKMKDAGVESYVGMCCGDFFLKRHHAFRDSGMDAVLLDIEGATCYELNEEHLAYAGAFKAEARLDLDAVNKLMAQVPAQPNRVCIASETGRHGKLCRSCGAAQKKVTRPAIADSPAGKQL